MKEIVATEYEYNDRGNAILIRYWYQMVLYSVKNVFISAKREAEKENKND